MKVNYVLMYGTPYLKYKEFEKFDDISKYLVNKGICNYRIFEPMEDLKEVEMIHLENDVRVLEDKIKQLQSQLKAKEELITIMERYFELIIDLGFDYDGLSQADSLKGLIDELVRYAKLGRACNTTEPIYVNKGNAYNILHEEILSKGENKEIEFDMLKALNEDLDDDIEMSNI